MSNKPPKTQLFFYGKRVEEEKHPFFSGNISALFRIVYEDAVARHRDYVVTGVDTVARTITFGND